MFRCPTPSGLAALFALAVPVAVPAQDGTPLLEFQLARASPCGGLDWVGGLDRVRIDAVILAVSGNRFTGEATGALRCRGAGSAVLEATASADFTARATLALSDCRVVDTEVTLGNLAAATPVAGPFSARIEAVLAQQIGAWAGNACEAMHGTR